MLNYKIKNKKSSRGFSLIELMVVITIIAMLAGVVAYNVSQGASEAKIQAAIIQIRNFDQLLEQYKIHAGKYPSKAQGLEALLEPIGLSKQPLIKERKIPFDPWKNPYIYLPPQPGQTSPIVRSLGFDGKPGGEGENADIDSLTITE